MVLNYAAIVHVQAKHGRGELAPGNHEISYKDSYVGVPLCGSHGSSNKTESVRVKGEEHNCISET